jgi:tRNA (guanine-N7-)-methyltransferase
VSHAAAAPPRRSQEGSPSVPITRIAHRGREIEELLTGGGRPHAELVHDLTAGDRWEVELGFGKGRYLLRRATEDAAVRFLGIEMVGEYFRLAARRSHRRSLRNLTLLQGEALYLLAAVLPAGFASAVHAYFPDPWPKVRHHRRRLYDRESVDLVLALLRPGGRILFASDHPQYGPEVAALLGARPELLVVRADRGWPDGARTNYEAKYVAEGRSIVRVEATLAGTVSEPARSVLAAVASAREE